jgi:hypothetical protein
MTEDFLQYVWQHQLLDHGLTTIDGQPVVVLCAGDYNHDAGPDFFNARVRIGDVEWVGNVEVHVRASDWKAHHHMEDKAYNNIILHVVYEQDCEITLQNGRVPPTVELKKYLHPSLIANYDALVRPAGDDEVPCSGMLGEVSEFVLKSFIGRLTIERIAAKTEVVKRLLDESRGGWEQTCYWLMARYFGGKVNALPFELLAKATDQRLLYRWKDNPQRVEALLMGQAGLLEGYFEDDYPRKLQADYNAIGGAAALNPIGGYMWKFYCLRPSSFPTIRISQFAQLLSTTSNLFATLLNATNAKELERLFDQHASEYWDSHYKFDKPTDKSLVKRIGRVQSQMLIINAWVPLLFLYGTEHGQDKYKDQAIDLLEQLPAEDNAVMRRWKRAGIEPSNAAESQALLQLYNKYCVGRRCLECGIGFQILKHK